MNNTILDYEKLQKKYGDFSEMILTMFEQFAIDMGMKELLLAMQNKNWGSAMVGCDLMLGYANYNYAYQFEQTVRKFYDYLNQFKVFNYDSNGTYILQFKQDFDFQAQLQAYQYFYPIIEQARLLKFEISKYTKSDVPENIYIEEGEQIKLQHEQLKQSIENQQAQQISHQQINPIDRPQNFICLDKCLIF